MRSKIHNLTVFLTLGLFMVLAACGGGSGDSGTSLDPNFSLASAAGLYSGTYGGSDSGDWTLSVNDNGSASGTFGGLPASGTVSDTGVVNLSINNDEYTITGVINGTNLNGTWNGDGVSGSISGSKQSSSSPDSPTSEPDASDGTSTTTAGDFAGQYSGSYTVTSNAGNESGEWSFRINSSGEIEGVISGTPIESVVTDNGEFTIVLEADGLSAILQGSITLVDDEVVVNGDWIDLEGTFTGGLSNTSSSEISEDEDEIFEDEDEISEDEDEIFEDEDDIIEGNDQNDCELTCVTFGIGGCDAMGFFLSCENNEDEIEELDDICEEPFPGSFECVGDTTYPSSGNTYTIDATYDFNFCTIEVEVEGIGSCGGNAADFIFEE